MTIPTSVTWIDCDCIYIIGVTKVKQNWWIRYKIITLANNFIGQWSFIAIRCVLKVSSAVGIPYAFLMDQARLSTSTGWPFNSSQPHVDKKKVLFNIKSLYWNSTFELMSTGGWELPEWSPCTVVYAPLDSRKQRITSLIFSDMRHPYSLHNSTLHIWRNLTIVERSRKNSKFWTWRLFRFGKCRLN